MGLKIFVSCKHSDMFDMQIEDENGNTILEHDGYGPDLPNFDAGGDYLSFTIDNDTGKIIGWKPITEADLEKFGDDEDDDDFEDSDDD